MPDELGGISPALEFVPTQDRGADSSTDKVGLWTSRLRAMPTTTTSTLSTFLPCPRRRRRHHRYWSPGEDAAPTPKTGINRRRELSSLWAGHPAHNGSRAARLVDRDSGHQSDRESTGATTQTRTYFRHPLSQSSGDEVSPILFDIWLLAP